MTNVPIERWVEEIIKRTIAEHVTACPLAPRVSKMEVRFASLLAFMAGSGTLGGLAGGILARLLIGA